MAAVREICRADGEVPGTEARALDALASRLDVDGAAEEAFFRRSSPRRLAAVVAELAAQGGGVDADAVVERLTQLAEEAARGDGRFSPEEQDALHAFVYALQRR